MRFSSMVCLWYAFTARAVAEIVHGATVSAVRNIILSYQPGARLFLFDVDNVLMAPCDRVLRYAGEYNNYRAQRFGALIDTFAEENVTVAGRICTKAEFLLSTIVVTGSVAPVSMRMPNLVRDLVQGGNHTVFALSTSAMGSWGRIMSGTLFLRKRLAHMGYVFSIKNSFLYAEPPVELDDGVLYTRGQSKGRSIATFLDKITALPEQVFMVDDRLTVLRILDQVMQDYPLRFIGIHYTELRDRAEVLDESIADQQFQTLYDKSVWLSDAQAYEGLLFWSPNQTNVHNAHSLRARV